jgi:2-alkyl-3-oxoalkanoate reductase
LLARGHSVCGMVRPAAPTPLWAESPGAEIFRADLRNPEGLEAALEGAEVVVHLAAAVIAQDASHYLQTLGGTQKLIEAVARSRTRRLLLAGSMSVYDWMSTRRELSESSPLEVRPYPRGAYASAKLWQERIVERAALEHGWQLTVVRPGVIWGPGNDALFIAGSAGRKFHLVYGPTRRLPLTYVENCASALVAAVEHPSPPPVVNIVDDDTMTAWRFMGEYLRRRGVPGLRVPIPFGALWLMARTAELVSRVCFGSGGKLPSLLIPCRLAVLKPLRFSNRLARECVGWKPQVRIEDALDMTFGVESQT